MLATIALAAGLLHAGAAAEAKSTPATGPARTDRADASALFNEGTHALARGSRAVSVEDLFPGEPKSGGARAGGSIQSLA